MALLKALLVNVSSLTPRIATKTGVVECNDVFTVSTLLSALTKLSNDFSGWTPLAARMAVARLGATKVASEAGVPRAPCHQRAHAEENRRLYSR